jgi:hypothetical protein
MALFVAKYSIQHCFIFSQLAELEGGNEESGGSAEV